MNMTWQNRDFLLDDFLVQRGQAKRNPYFTFSIVLESVSALRADYMFN